MVGLSHDVKRPDLEADHSPTAFNINGELRNARKYISTPPHAFVAFTEKTFTKGTPRFN
jgi:hypothetical protein